MSKIEPKPNHTLVKKERKKSIIIITIVSVVVLVLLGLGLWYFVFSKDGDEGGIDLFGDGSAEGGADERITSPLSGLEISEDQLAKRPYAVMYGADTIARPLSGLGQAEIVFEMPAGRGFLTRMMGVFWINDPDEIGSIRSARHDFIPMARYLDAVLVHWGGSYRALTHLGYGWVDDIDALTDGAAFYRVNRIQAPYNGFTSATLVREEMDRQGFSRAGTFDGYEFEEDGEESARPESDSSLVIPYPGEYAVEFKYNKPENKYIRYQGGELIIDRNTDTEVTAKNVVVMYTPWRQLDSKSQYLEIDVEESGSCEFYKNGEQIPCDWKKGELEDKLTFTDKEGNEIPFVAGHTFVEIIAPSDTATWTPIVLNETTP